MLKKRGYPVHCTSASLRTWRSSVVQPTIISSLTCASVADVLIAVVSNLIY